MGKIRTTMIGLGVAITAFSGLVGVAGATPPTVDQQVVSLAEAQVPTMLLVIFGLAGATAVVALARWGVNALFGVFNSGGKKAAK